MVEDRIGLRYAKSLYGLAQEKGVLDAVRNDMALIHDVCVQNRDFVQMLQSPLIRRDIKGRVIKAIFADKFTHDFSMQLAEIMLRKGRERYFDNIAKAFLELHDAANRVRHGKLISASPLSESQLAQIRAYLEKQNGETFDLELEVDPSLIGGFVLKVGDTLFDGSISRSLRKLDQDFKKNAYIRHI